MDQRRERWFAYSVILLGWAVRLGWLVESSIWYDESFTLVHAQAGPWRALLSLGRLDNAPPLYGVLLSLWIGLFGSGEFAVRFFSALVGMAALPLIGRWGGALTGRRIEWGPMLFVATCPIFVRYGYEVRMYALGISLAAAFGWLGWRLHTGQLRRIAPYVLVGIAMLLSHIYTGFLWATLLVVGAAAWLARRLPDAKRWWAANVLLALAALPVAAWALWRASVDTTAYGAIPFSLALSHSRSLPLQYGLSPFLDPPWGQIALGILVLSALLGCARLVQARRWQALGLVIGGLSLPALLLLTAGQFIGKWGPQYLLFSWGMVLALAVGLGWHGPRGALRSPRALAYAGPALALAWAAMALPALQEMSQGNWRMLRDEFNPRPDFRAVAHYIEAHDAPGDAILVINGIAAHTLQYYYQGEAPILGLPEAFVIDTRHPVNLQHLHDVEQRIGPASRLWLVLWTDLIADPNNQVLDVLLERCDCLPVGQEFANVGLLLFDLEACRPLDAALVPPEPIGARFGPLELLGNSLEIQGGQITLSLWWAAREPVERDLTVFVHLVRDGELIVQDDRLLGTERFPTSMWESGTVIKTKHRISLPSEDCAGCALYVGLYDRQEIERIGGVGRVLLPDGSDHVQLGLLLDPIYTEPLPLDEPFGPLRLTGYRLWGEESAVALTLWWQSEATMPTDYAAFVHLVRDGEKIAQDDRALGGDGFPTRLWEPGTVMRTRHRIPLPEGGCPGCTLRIGIYDYRKAIRTAQYERVLRPDGTSYLELPLP